MDKKDLNRIKVMLVEKKKTSKWLAEEKQIIQGSIGYSSITRTIIKLLRESSNLDGKNLFPTIQRIIMSFNVNENNWRKGGAYSKYSSESGIRIISEELLHSVKR